MNNKKEKSIKIAKDYIEKKGEKPSRFTFVFKGTTADDKSTVEALYDEDVKSITPGGGSGKSLKLEIDLHNDRVQQALRYQ
jgi:hypothetical protein